ncbi:hypothetical protein GCM10023092_21760 [Rurimicrobium arvi]|uniref:Nucleotidyltransferase-Associated Rossmannoid Fold domain-containing protein n=1 Tax=Rurimicrobium arvi TaxID=2049916 RepID=A0ABP8MY68_9BACT
MEDYKTNIDNFSKIEVQKSANSLKKEIDEDYKSVKNLFTLLLIFGIPTTGYSVYMMFWGVSKKVKKTINEKIETIVEQKREEIIKLINSQEFESNLKNTKKILVISPNEDAQDEIKRTMSNFKFKNVLFRIHKSFTTVPEHDLIVFNNVDGEFLQKEINEIMADINGDDVCFVAYTTKNLERNPRLNFANAKYTLYHSILSTLSYVESLKEA